MSLVSAYTVPTGISKCPRVTEIKMSQLHSQSGSSCYGSMDSELPPIQDAGLPKIRLCVNGCQQNSANTESTAETDMHTSISVTSLSEQAISPVQWENCKTGKDWRTAGKQNKSKEIAPKEGVKIKRLLFLSELLDEPRTQPLHLSSSSHDLDTASRKKRRPKTAGDGERLRTRLPQRPKTASMVIACGDATSRRMGDKRVQAESVDGAKNKIRQESMCRRLMRQNVDCETKIGNIKFRTSLPAEKKVAWLNLKREREAAVIEERKCRKQRLRNLYWTAQWKVVWIIRWLKFMIKHSINITPKTATEMQYHQLNNSIEARDLAFNKDVYGRERIHTRLAPWALSILSKEPSERTENDCRRLHALLRGLKSFDKFTERIQLALCQSFLYQYVESDRVVLRKGHVGLNFYFIFSGSVFVDVEEHDSAGNAFLQTDTILTRGSSFGELALLKDITRQANIRCREACELLVVEKEIFSNVCPRIFDQELEEKVDFISNMPLFQTKWWTDDALQSICFEAQIQEYKTGKIIVTDSANDDWIYICMEGKCTIYKHLELESELLPNGDRRRSTFYRDITVESQQDSATREAREKRAITEAKEQNEKHKLDKTRLLNSMALEWVDVHEKLKEVVNIHEEEDAVKTAKKSLEDRTKPRKIEQEEPTSGVTSFTSFIVEKKAQAKNKELVFLSIGTLSPLEVFDLFAIVRNGCGIASLILVSSGAKLLRIKRTRFFACAAPEALQHAKMISNKDEYKTDGELLYSYELKNKWDGFKHEVVTQVIEPHIEEARRRYLVNYAEGKQADKKRQAEKLMTVLRKNKQRQKLEARLRELDEKREKQEKAKKIAFVDEDEDDRKIRILASANKNVKCDMSKKKTLAKTNSQRWNVPITQITNS